MKQNYFWTYERKILLRNSCHQSCRDEAEGRPRNSACCHAPTPRSASLLVDIRGSRHPPRPSTPLSHSQATELSFRASTVIQKDYCVSWLCTQLRSLPASIQTGATFFPPAIFHSAKQQCIHHATYIRLHYVMDFQLHFLSNVIQLPSREDLGNWCRYLNFRERPPESIRVLLHVAPHAVILDLISESGPSDSSSQLAFRSSTISTESNLWIYPIRHYFEAQPEQRT